MAEPCLLISVDGAGFQATGPVVCRLGHELPRPGGGLPDGVYGGWAWDGCAVRADCDRYGLFPLYYFSTPERFAISPSIPALLALDPARDLDDSALAVFLRLGFFLGEDTPFRAIRALPPGALLEWKAGHPQVSGGFPPWRPQALTRDAALDGFIDLFRSAMARRERPAQAVAVPLSSGRDSRHILLELCRVDRKPAFCVTMRHFPPTSNEDEAVARLLARRLRVPHVVLSQRESRMQAELRKNRITSFCADEHAWIVPLAEYLRGRVQSVYDGIGGDVLSAGLYLDEARLQRFASGQFDQLALDLLRRFEARTPELVASEWAGRWGHDRAAARLSSELARHADAPNPVGSFFFWNRTRREISLQSYRIMNQNVEVLAPYLDHDLFDFLASLPAAMLLDREFHSDAIRRGYPEYEDVRYEDRSVRSFWSPFHFRRYAMEVAALARRNAVAPPVVQLADTTTILNRAVQGVALGSRPRMDWRMLGFATYLMQLSAEMASPTV